MTNLYTYHKSYVSNKTYIVESVSNNDDPLELNSSSLSNISFIEVFPDTQGNVVCLPRGKHNLSFVAHFTKIDDYILPGNPVVLGIVRIGDDYRVFSETIMKGTVLNDNGSRYDNDISFTYSFSMATNTYLATKLNILVILLVDTTGTNYFSIEANGALLSIDSEVSDQYGNYRQHKYTSALSSPLLKGYFQGQDIILFTDTLNENTLDVNYHNDDSIISVRKTEEIGNTFMIKKSGFYRFSIVVSLNINFDLSIPTNVDTIPYCMIITLLLFINKNTQCIYRSRTTIDWSLGAHKILKSVYEGYLRRYDVLYIAIESSIYPRNYEDDQVPTISILSSRTMTQNQQGKEKSAYAQLAMNICRITSS